MLKLVECADCVEIKDGDLCVAVLRLTPEIGDICVVDTRPIATTNVGFYFVKMQYDHMLTESITAIRSALDIDPDSLTIAGKVIAIEDAPVGNFLEVWIKDATVVADELQKKFGNEPIKDTTVVVVPKPTHHIPTLAEPTYAELVKPTKVSDNVVDFPTFGYEDL